MKKILIIGDVMLDHYQHGDCNRISPEAPVPVVNIRHEEWRLGGAANVANNLAALNIPSALIGICGQDSQAVQLDNLISATGMISNKLFQSHFRPTIVKSRVLVGSHQMLRMDREDVSTLNREEEKGVLDNFYREIEGAGMVLVSDYSKGVLSRRVLEIVFNTCDALGIPSIVDPKSSDFSIYRGATYIKPNRAEAEKATGTKITDSSSLGIACNLIRDITGAKAVITTLSEDGVSIYGNHGLKMIPTRARKVFDVTGAGDTFLAALACEYLNTGDLYASCEFANLAAAVVVSKIGSATASIGEIEQIRQVHYSAIPTR